ncbi:hypothetical protein RCL1_008447 [Eukaryota sp. TZLM3-RCL]
MVHYSIVSGKGTTKWVKSYNPHAPTRSFQHPVFHDQEGEFFVDNLNRKIYLSDIDRQAVHLIGSEPPQFEDGEMWRESAPSTSHHGPTSHRNWDITDPHTRPHGSLRGKHIS